MATIKDIAKIAGVSTSTVSHVVNHTRYVSPELVEKVERAIQELDELPNFIIKKTRTGHGACSRRKAACFRDRSKKTSGICWRLPNIRWCPRNTTRIPPVWRC